MSARIPRRSAASRSIATRCAATFWSAPAPDMGLMMAITLTDGLESFAIVASSYRLAGCFDPRPEAAYEKQNRAADAADPVRRRFGCDRILHLDVGDGAASRNREGAPLR